ncbi:hypothetical protein [Streptomyces sp. NPDC093089]|uniref:hypothetical protein n=1 Tax=Streptomyces sp. NPDC093089 TaxID=3366024 RepID=UPI003819DDBF
MFIGILQELGAVNVVRPAVVRLMWQQQQDERLGLRDLRQQRHSAPRLDRTGREACRSCFKAECTEDPTSDLLQFLAGRPLGVREDTLRAVIAEVTEGKLTITRFLHWDVQNLPCSPATPTTVHRGLQRGRADDLARHPRPFPPLTLRQNRIRSSANTAAPGLQRALRPRALSDRPRLRPRLLERTPTFDGEPT